MNILILQCGGPTPVFNASLAAIISACQTQPKIKQIWGCPQGLQGLMQGGWVDLSGLSEAKLAQIRRQPGGILGAGRHRIVENERVQMIEHLRQKAIDVIFMIGGNGTMGAGQSIARQAQAGGYPLQVVGIPKTIDNDLMGTDCAPGYGSAARFIAQTTRDIGLDLMTMRNFDDVAILEVMGRHTGWLTGATALARQWAGDAPHLILLPEVPLDEDKFLQAVARIHKERGVCFIAAAEGVRDSAGQFLAEKGREISRDASGQKLLSHAAGTAPYLTGRIRSELGILCRQIRPDTIQRSSSLMVSEVDRALAEQVGTQAVVAVVDGETGVMVGLKRAGSRWLSSLVPFDEVIGRERMVPHSYINSENFDVAEAFTDYAKPLIGGLRANVRLVDM